MSNIICPECSAPSNVNSSSCPLCGYPFPPTPPSEAATPAPQKLAKRWIPLAIVAFLTVIGLAIGIALKLSGDKNSDPQKEKIAQATPPKSPKPEAAPPKPVDPNAPPPLTGVQPSNRPQNTDSLPNTPSLIGSLQPKPAAPQPASGLEAYYPFNSNTQDASGKNRHGTFKKPSRGYVPGKIGTGVALTSSTSIALPLGHFTEGTISLWIKPEAIGKHNHLVSAHGFVPDYVTIQSEILQQGYPYAAINTAPANWQHCDLMRRAPVPLRQWHHVAFTWGARGLHLYLNGQLIAVGKSMKDSMKLPIYPNHIPGPPVAPVRLNKNTKEWRLGAMAKSRDNQGLVGVMDEVRIYSKALTAQEIATLAR